VYLNLQNLHGCIVEESHIRTKPSTDSTGSTGLQLLWNPKIHRRVNKSLQVVFGPSSRTQIPETHCDNIRPHVPFYFYFFKDLLQSKYVQHVQGQVTKLFS
jgi:hypothetical protein